MIALALRTLEDAVAGALDGPIARQWGHRLALAMLAREGVAELWQAQDFWQELGEESFAINTAYARHHRATQFYGFLDTWHLRAGIERPCWVRRAEWRRAALDDALDDGHLSLMCNRYQPGERTRIERLFGARALRAFNEGPATVHPKDPGWVVRMQDGALVLDQMIWGFPFTFTGKKGQKLKPTPVNNARFDKLGSTWRRWTGREHRCLIPTARFAEAVGAKGKMTETWLSVKGEEMFAWAGLWRESEEWGSCYTGVMTENAPELHDIHDRSPVILEKGEWDSWLKAPIDTLAQFDRPFPAERVAIEATDTPWVRR